jgi:hypothetical protein
MPDAHQTFHPSEVGKLYQLWLGAKSSSHGHGVVSVELLLGPFHSSFCSWSVSYKTGSGHFRCKIRYHLESL